MRCASSCLIVCVFCVSADMVSGITITKFEDDKAGFLAATGATSATGPLPDTGSTQYTTNTIGDLTFSSSSGFFFDDFTSKLPGAEIGINGADSLSIDIASTVAAFGFDWHDLNTTDGTFTATLLLDLVPLTTFSFATSAPDTGTFIGWLSDEPFNRVEILEVQTVNRNETYGEFFTAAPVFIPEPSTLTLAGLLLGGMALRRKKKAGAHRHAWRGANV